MATPLPVIVITSMDDVLRRTAASAVLCDLPRSVVVQHDLQGLASDDALRRIVYDIDGIVEEAAVPLDHACLSCALREDVVPAVVRLAQAGRWDGLVLALPVAAEPGLVLHALRGAVVDGRHASSAVRPAGVLATVDLGSLVGDLFGDALLVERGLAMTTDDRRAVGEVIAHQVECADIVATGGTGGMSPQAATVLRHLVPPASTVADVHEMDLAGTLGGAAAVRGPDRGDYRRAEFWSAAEGDGVWTLDLASSISQGDASGAGDGSGCPRVLGPSAGGTARAGSSASAPSGGGAAPARRPASLSPASTTGGTGSARRSSGCS
jgi:hypothetical protein